MPQLLRFSLRLVPVTVALVAIWILGYSQTRSDDRPGVPVSEVAVIDGDTIQLGGRVIQLYGIDAPELGQRCYHDAIWAPCGQLAALALRKLILVEHAPLRCAPVSGADVTAANVCLVGDVDVARVLLADGLVVVADDPEPGYREAAARRASLGLWHSRFQPPAEWRSGARFPDGPAAELEPCPVKAVISAAGDRFHYVPTDAAYSSLEVDSPAGGQVFCSDEEARRAGWQREGEIAVKARDRDG